MSRPERERRGQTERDRFREKERGFALELLASRDWQTTRMSSLGR